MCNKRNKTPSEHIGHGLCLHFLGVSLRNIARALSFLHIIKRSHVAVWKWIQKHKPRRKTASEKRRISGYSIDEKLVKADSGFVWLWVAIEPKNKQTLALIMSKERNMFVTERFTFGLI